MDTISAPAFSYDESDAGLKALGESSMSTARLRSAIERLERSARATQTTDRALYHLLAHALVLRAPELTQVHAPSLELQETIAWAERRYEDAEALAALRRRSGPVNTDDPADRVDALLSSVPHAP